LRAYGGWRPPWNKAAEKPSRERVLSDQELVQIWHATPDNYYGAIVRLLLLLGQRRDEVGSMRWSQIDLNERTWTIPPERTKNRKAHVVPLSDLAVTIIETIGERADRDLVFGSGAGGYSGWSHSKRDLDQAAKIKEPPWVLHDLRSTVATGLQRLGVRLEVAEAVLNHVSGSRGGIVGVYQRHDWKDEKRAALNAWSEHVQSLIAGQSKSNVRKLRA
jgi:integrase